MKCIENEMKSRWVVIERVKITNNKLVANFSFMMDRQNDISILRLIVEKTVLVSTDKMDGQAHIISYILIISIYLYYSIKEIKLPFCWVLITFGGATWCSVCCIVRLSESRVWCIPSGVAARAVKNPLVKKKH